MANAGLTVKERLALLQNNNSNTTSNAANTACGPLKSASNVSPKPKPSPTEAKPPGTVGFKPVTPSKPAAPSHKVNASHNAETADKAVTTPDKPVPANKPVPSENRPVISSKPALASKPGTAVKPFNFSSATSAKADEAGKVNGSDSPLFPKLRPVGGPPGKVTPPTSKQPTSPSHELGGGSEKPAVSPQANSSEETRGSDSSSSSAEMRDKPRSIVSPLKPVSVQERLAAFRQKSLDAGTTEPKLKQHDSVSPTPKSTTTAKPSSVFPPSAVSGVLKPMNGQQSDGPEPKPESPAIKRSDIAKSLTQAADRVLRSKVAGNSSAAEKKRDSQLFQRHSDGKKFRKLDVASVVSSEPAPAKSGRLDDVNLQPFLKAYAAAKEEKLNVDAGKSGVPAEGEDGDVEELYVEAESTSVPIRGRKGSAKQATSVRVSLIPEFTEEEEEEWDHCNDDISDAPIPQPAAPEETYDDCQSTEEQPQKQKPLPDEPDEIYEPLDEQLPEECETTEPDPVPPPLPSPNTAEDRKSRDKDKENKEKEEAAKKRDKAKDEANKKEKERKKKEEDLKKMRRKFGLSDSDEKVGDGVVKSNAGGGVFSKDLAVVKGETIAILRMDGNPAGKWLVQNEHGKIGFVNSNNIEISTPTIRHLMAGVKHDAGASEEPDDMYEALPGEDMDEIYEEL